MLDKSNFILDIEKIRIQAKKLGIQNLGELCKKANIHQNSITPYIQKKRSPFTQVVLDIANCLNMPATECICQSEDEVTVKVKQMIMTALNPEHAVFLFGSRARGSANKFSDIDLGITGGNKKITFEEFSKIKSGIDDLFDNFSLSIDLVDLDLAPLDFLVDIEKDLTFLCGNQNTANFFLGYINGRKEN